MNAQLAERPSTELAMLPPLERAQSILKSSDLAPKLIALAKESKHIVAITNADGCKQVHAKRMVLKTERIALEKAGKGAREDATAFSKAVIAEEDRLIGLIKPEETRLETLQGVWDAKIETEKEAERLRQQRIVDDARAVIQWFRDQPVAAVSITATAIADMLRVVELAPLTELPEKFIREGEAAKLLAIAKLGDMYAARKGFEFDQAELQAQQQALDAQKVEQDAEQARIAKAAEDERAELLAISSVLASCIGQSASVIGETLDAFRNDPPVSPTTDVQSAYDQAIQKLITLRQDGLARETQQLRDDDARADRERIESIKRRIDGIRFAAQQAVGRSSEAIAVLITEVSETPSEVAGVSVFDEFSSNANTAIVETLAALNALHSEAVHRERLDADFRAQAAADQQRKVDEGIKAREDADRQAQEAIELERAETQALIAECTLLDAAILALIVMRESGLGEVVAAKMLASAIERAA